MCGVCSLPFCGSASHGNIAPRRPRACARASAAGRVRERNITSDFARCGCNSSSAGKTQVSLSQNTWPA